MIQQKPLVFISCGQYSVEEKRLGQDVEMLVRELTPCDAYFGQSQSDLDGLTEHIFGELDRCVGFIAIMHNRGSVKTPEGEITRASVWIEQEIAIAAFLKQVHKTSICVRAYIHRGIKLEGVRQFVLLNPVPFDSHDEVIQDLRQFLQQWRQTMPADGMTPQAEVTHPVTLMRKEDGRFELSFEVILKNTGAMRMEDYVVEIEFPSTFLNPSTFYAAEVPGRRTPTHIFFRNTNDSLGKGNIFPGDNLKVFIVNFFFDNTIHTSADVERKVVVRILSKDKLLLEEESTIGSLLPAQVRDR